MMTDDVSFEFPFALPDGIRVLDGKAALAAYLPNVGRLFAIEALNLQRSIIAGDGTAAVLEFSARAYAKETGARYDQSYISVVDLRDGLISRYRDYWNPLVVIAAVGGADKANAALKGGSLEPRQETGATS
jgi:uncharacterized protein